MAQLKVVIPDTSLGVRRGAAMPNAGQITVGAGQLPGPPDLARFDPATAAAGWQGVKKAAEDAQQLAALVQAAETDAAYNAASVRGLQAIAAAEAESRGNITRYREMTSSAFASIADGITDRGARAKFLSSMPREAASVEFRVQRRGAEIAGGAAVAELEKFLGEQANAGAAAPTPQERANAMLRGGERITAAVQAGYLSPQVARTRLERFQGQISEGAVRRLLIDNPTEAARLLRDPRELPGLQPVQRYRLLDQTIRRGRVAAGGLPIGEGPSPQDVPDVPPEEQAAIQREGDAVAFAAMTQQRQAAAFQEQQAFRRWDDTATAAAEQFFVGISNGTAFDVAQVEAVADLLPPEVAQAARVVADTGGATEPDDRVMRDLLFQAGTVDPQTFARTTAAEVAAGRITPLLMTELNKANRDLMADPPARRAWRRARTDAAAIVDAPDMAELGVPRMDDVQATALMEMDAWRAANPQASPIEANAATREIAMRHRQAMSDRVIATLPPLYGLGNGPYTPEALDDLEADILDDFEQGHGAISDVARLLRTIDAWRWAGEDLAPEGMRR